MYEVELKVRAAHEPVRTALAERGAEAGEHVVEEDTYYDAPHRAFEETDEALRVRRRTPRGDGDEGTATTARLTYKGPLIEERSKTREEFETTVSDPDAVTSALDALGFSAAADIEKQRERFHVEGCTLTLDDVAGLGEFVEVEREVEVESEVAEARERAADLLRDLGLDPETQIRTSYLELVLDAGE